MKTLLPCYALLGFLLLSSSACCQVVNGYAEVTAIAGATFTIGAVDETSDTFEDDEWVVVMQMQDNTLGNVSNSASFGDLGAINSAGLYEIRQIDSHTETAGTPTSITFKNNTNNTFNTCANCSVQLITFRSFGTPDYITTADMSSLAWDGQIGGVLAIYVEGTLTLAHNLDADLDGFSGGGPNSGGSTGCQGNSNYRVVTQANMADKAEGIHKRTTAAYAAGMGKILNAGGGGGSHNGGGGGGGNYTAGGRGGPGWNNCNPGAGGLGGLSLAGSIAVDRVFMGGGGGAGEGNNNLATDGGDGGGIILVKADEIVTTACAGLSITTNGESIAFAGNDGGGGGGAAGSIVLDVNTWSINAACPLTVEAAGGNGGGVNSGATHGGGGGGGQGVIFYSTTEPTSNVSSTTTNGIGGCNNNSNPCNSQAESGSGPNDAGVIELLTGPLPIELSSFTAVKNNKQVDINWTTSSETDNKLFIVERSNHGFKWDPIVEIDGNENSSASIDYAAIDPNPFMGTNYYRLKQVDFNLDFTYSEIRRVDFKTEDLVVIFPNPANNELLIFRNGLTDFEVNIFNSTGQLVKIPFENINAQKVFDTSLVPSGIYMVAVSTQDGRAIYKVSIEH